MLPKTFTWELDPYGTSSDNKITAERKVLSSTQDGTFMFIIPKAAPFFAESVVLKHVATGRTLTKGIDWEPGYRFDLVSQRTYKPVYGAISILDKTLTGTFEYTYQTLGGEFTLDEQTLLEMLSNALTDPRVTTWEKITNVPWYFTPIQHLFDVADMVGGKELATALNTIADKILASAERLYPSINVHIQDTNNPHAVTKAQVGLGNVPNFPLCTEQEALDGVRLDRFISPGHVSKMIAKLNSTTVAGHVADKSNPHGTTAAQVGLGNVDNYVTATDVTAIDKTADNAFMTPRKTWLAVKSWVADAFTAHVANTSNPHNTTAAQLGLGNVVNIGLATTVDAQAGTGNNGVMTPYLTSLAIAAQAGASGVQAHVSNTNNPHNTTAAQVGLGNVDNFATATQAQAEAGTASNLFMTPLTTAALIAKTATAALNTHIANTANPHGTTKAQVGLGNVDNYATATQTELDAGTSNAHFVTVAGVVSLIASRIGTALTDHVNNKSNPHTVTKAQIGLSNVQNFGVGTDADYTAGNSTTLYPTIYGVSQMIARLSSGTLAGHLSDFANPHQVTKAQVGLGSVDNFATATQAELDVGTASNRFTTPAGVTSMITRLVGGTLTTHVNDLNNPHAVTKAQVGLGSVVNAGFSVQSDWDAGTATALYISPAGVVSIASRLIAAFAATITKATVGLGSVDNYATASQAELDTGTATNRFTTPAGVTSMITRVLNAYTPPAIVTHIADQGNPHAVTKTQVGLGNVDNYATASQAELDTGTATNRFTTPAGVTSMITRVLNAYTPPAIVTHIADHSNPHQVTKAQVGLGSVDNYATATQAELDVGTASNRFTTPAGVTSMITRVLNAYTPPAIATHVADQGNPHAVTKTQVGLGNVDNFATATIADALTGSSTLFVTPAVALSLANNINQNGKLPTFLTAGASGAANYGNYRAMEVGVALNFPAVTNGVIRVIVDHAANLANGTVTVVAPDGETFDSFAGVDSTLSLTEIGHEYIFVRYNNQWRVS